METITLVSFWSGVVVGLSHSRLFDMLLNYLLSPKTKEISTQTEEVVDDLEDIAMETKEIVEDVKEIESDVEGWFWN